MGKHLEFIGGAEVISAGREAEGDQSFAGLLFAEGSDHSAVVLFPNPAVTLNRHASPGADRHFLTGKICLQWFDLEEPILRNSLGNDNGGRESWEKCLADHHRIAEGGLFPRENAGISISFIP
jgi:hypothetical protein